MTTKKKNSPSERKGKTGSFQEAQRQDQRVGELWNPSSPTMKDMFATFRRLRISLDAALAAVDGFVSESKRVADQLRKEDRESIANSLSGWADEWAGVTTPAFRKAATGIVELVYSALVNGYPVHVLEVERPLLGRDRAEWGRLCASQRYLLQTDGTEQHEADQPFAVELIHELRRIDDRAKGLKVGQVIEAANGRTKTGSGFAAELACLSGAFDYRPEDQEKAQVAIAKAMKGGG